MNPNANSQPGYNPSAPSGHLPLHKGGFEAAFRRLEPCRRFYRFAGGVVRVDGLYRRVVEGADPYIFIRDWG